VDVPLYATNTPEQVGYMLRDSGAKVAIVSSREQRDKLAAAGDLPALEHVVVMNAGEEGTDESFHALIRNSADFEGADAGFDALVKQAKPEDLCTIIYTSGTTGEPKGVELTHGNLASNVSISTGPMGFGAKDSCISFLPLSHVTARHVDYALMCAGAKLAYLPKFDLLVGAMKQVHPTIFVGVPRVYEKIRQGVEGKSAHSPVKKRILEWAVATGRKHRATILAGKQPSALSWKIADKLVYSKIREAFGGCVKDFVSGGAPLGMDSAGWFADVGIRIFEGYGLTETSPVISRNTFDGYRIGTVGTVIPNLELRMAEDGEIEVRGTTVFAGYWQREEATQAEFTADGWFKTGDIGKYEDGFLSITDRKKELIKTSSGKYIAPQPIEGKLKADELVGNAAVIGDSRKFAAVLISPDFQALGRWAAEHGVTAKDPKQLVKDPKVKAQYESIVKKVNAELQDHERMKKVGVMPEEWSIEGGELTPSMKLKRRVIFERYKDRIDALYGGE
jgi:long-chain acyl-CoA synthetase